jgi:AcrR family transcriptional regulator
MADAQATATTRTAAPDTDVTATKILDAALAELTDYGIRRVSVDDIAARAGVHRTTVYRYFPNRAAILQASALKWLHDTFGRINDEVQGLWRDERLVEGFALSLAACQEEPLAKKVLGPDGDAALRALTVDGGPIIGMVTAVLVQWLWEDDDAGPPNDAAQTMEVLVRLGLSFALTSEGTFDMRSHEGRTDFARKYLLPLFDN